MGGNKMFTGLKVPRQCPLVLLVKVAGNKVKRWEVKKVAAGEGLFGLCSRGEELSMWTGQHHNGLSMWTGQQRGRAEHVDWASEGKSDHVYWAAEGRS